MENSRDDLQPKTLATGGGMGRFYGKVLKKYALRYEFLCKTKTLVMKMS